MHSCKLYLNEKEVGDVVWENVGSRVDVRASCALEDGAFYRVFVCGPQGESLALGLMMPQNGRFFVRKQIPSRQADVLLTQTPKALRGEIVRSRPGEAEPAPPSTGWGSGPLPFAFSALAPMNDAPEIEDTQLGECLKRQPGVLCARHKDMTYIVFPLEVGGDLACAPFFCLITPVYERGKPYGALAVDAQSRVRVIPKREARRL